MHACTLDLEVATVFSLAELDRKKGGGLIIKRPEEKIKFITKIGYPLWLFPWSKTTLIFDGLGKSSYTFLYTVFPDVKAFMENLERSSKIREAYSAFLSDNLNYFSSSVTEKSFLATGLISDSKFLSEFDSYRREETKIDETQPPNIALLPPMLDESAIAHVAQEFGMLHSAFKENVDVLRRCMSLLKKVTNTLIKACMHAEANITQLENLGIKPIAESHEIKLVYVPFYLIGYQMNSKKRYMFLPPSVVNTIGLSTKLKGVLGRTKINRLLVPRFRALNSLKDTTQMLIQQSAEFETEVTQLGEKANILAMDFMREEISKGLAYLRNEGWFSDKEYNIIRRRLT